MLHGWEAGIPDWAKRYTRPSPVDLSAGSCPLPSTCSLCCMTTIYKPATYEALQRHNRVASSQGEPFGRPFATMTRASTEAGSGSPSIYPISSYTYKVVTGRSGTSLPLHVGKRMDPGVCGSGSGGLREPEAQAPRVSIRSHPSPLPHGAYEGACVNAYTVHPKRLYDVHNMHHSLAPDPDGSCHNDPGESHRYQPVRLADQAASKMPTPASTCTQNLSFAAPLPWSVITRPPMLMQVATALATHPAVQQTGRRRHCTAHLHLLCPHVPSSSPSSPPRPPPASHANRPARTAPTIHLPSSHMHPLSPITPPHVPPHSQLLLPTAHHLRARGPLRRRPLPSCFRSMLSPLCPFLRPFLLFRLGQAARACVGLAALVHLPQVGPAHLL